MELTPAESQVVQLLKQRQVAAYAELARQLDVSAKTVQRALRKAGAYRQRQRQFRLRHPQGHSPVSMAAGCGATRELRFSRHGDLPRTIQDACRAVQPRMHVGGTAAVAGHSRA